MPTLDTLPAEIYAAILDRLEHPDIQALCLTSRRLFFATWEKAGDFPRRLDLRVPALEAWSARLNMTPSPFLVPLTSLRIGLKCCDITRTTQDRRKMPQIQRQEENDLAEAMAWMGLGNPHDSPTRSPSSSSPIPFPPSLRHLRIADIKYGSPPLYHALIRALPVYTPLLTSLHISTRLHSGVSVPMEVLREIPTLRDLTLDLQRDNGARWNFSALPPLLTALSITDNGCLTLEQIQGIPRQLPHLTHLAMLGIGDQLWVVLLKALAADRPEHLSTLRIGGRPVRQRVLTPTVPPAPTLTDALSLLGGDMRKALPLTNMEIGHLHVEPGEDLLLCIHREWGSTLSTLRLIGKDTLTFPPGLSWPRLSNLHLRGIDSVLFPPISGESPLFPNLKYLTLQAIGEVTAREPRSSPTFPRLIQAVLHGVPPEACAQAIRDDLPLLWIQSERIDDVNALAETICTHSIRTLRLGQARAGISQGRSRLYDRLMSLGCDRVGNIVLDK